jgi:chloride channel 3/4/5
VILVENLGRLAGLVTVKDILHFTAHAEAPDTSREGVGRLLDEGWDWAVGTWDRGMAWARRTLRR